MAAASKLQTFLRSHSPADSDNGGDGGNSASGIGYDSDHALALCVSSGFVEGSLFLYERRGLHGEVLRWHAAAGDTAAALKTCR